MSVMNRTNTEDVSIHAVFALSSFGGSAAAASTAKTKESAAMRMVMALAFNSPW